MSEMTLLRAMNMVDDGFLDEMNTFKKKTSHGNRRLSTFIVIAAIISLLGLSVFAAEHILPIDYWFYKYFSNDPTPEVINELSENQQEILEHGLVAINQSITDNGWTITLESGISDGYRMLIKYRIEAPDGVILNADNYGLDYTTDIKPPKAEAYNLGAGYYGGDKLEDEDVMDNTVTKLIECTVLPPEGEVFSITDGTVWTIRFHSIKEENGSLDDFTRKTLCEGNWEFNVIFTDDLLVTDSVELLDNSVQCSATRYFRSNRFDIKVKVTSFELRTLTATVRYNRPITGFWEGVLLNPIYVVMNDGARVAATYSQGLNRNDHVECILTFDRPVSVDDVAYIDFPYAGEVPIID